MLQHRTDFVREDRREYAELRRVGLYYYAHFGYGRAVAILPFRHTAADLELLARLEVRPSHGAGMELGAITGRYDNPAISLLACAVKEVSEEAGYIVDPDTVIDLGETWDSKVTDSIYHLFAVDISDPAIRRCEAVDVGPETGYPQWITPAEVSRTTDPILAMTYLRLAAHLKLPGQD